MLSEPPFQLINLRLGEQNPASSSVAGEGEGQLVLPAMQRRVRREVGWEVRGEMVLWKSCRVFVGLEGCPEGSGHAVHVVLHGCYRRLHEATNCMVDELWAS